MNVVEKKYGECDEVYADIENGMLVWEYSSYNVKGIDGKIYYYFSDSDVVEKISFVYKPTKSNMKKIRKYLKRHYGNYKVLEDGSIMYRGENLKYKMKKLQASNLMEVTIESK